MENFLTPGQFNCNRILLPGVLIFNWLEQEIEATPLLGAESWSIDHNENQYFLKTGESGYHIAYIPDREEMVVCRDEEKWCHSISVSRNGDIEYLDQHLITRNGNREEVLELEFSVRGELSDAKIIWRELLCSEDGLCHTIERLLWTSSRLAMAIATRLPGNAWVETLQKYLKRIPSDVLREYRIDPACDRPLPPDVVARLEADYMPNGIPSTRTEMNSVTIHFHKRGEEERLQARWHTRDKLSKLPPGATLQFVNFFGKVPEAAFEATGGQLTIAEYATTDGDMEWELDDCYDIWKMLRHYSRIACRSFPALDRLVALWHEHEDEYNEWITILELKARSD